MNFSKFLNEFVKIDLSISLGCYIELSKFIQGFLFAATWICQNSYLNFSKLLYGFVKVIQEFVKKCYVDLSKLFSVFLALCQTKPSLLKFLL